MKKYGLSLTCMSLLLLSFNNIITSDYIREPTPLTAYKKVPNYASLFGATTLLSIAGLSLYFAINPDENICPEDPLLMILSTLVCGTIGATGIGAEYVAYRHKNQPTLTIDKEGIIYIQGAIIRNRIIIPWSTIKSIIYYQSMLQGILIDSSLHGNILLITNDLDVSQEEIYQTIQHFIIAHQRGLK